MSFYMNGSIVSANKPQTLKLQTTVEVCPTISFDIFSSSDFDAEGYPVCASIGKVPNTLLLLTT
jgi:hypothetical protein